MDDKELNDLLESALHEFEEERVAESFQQPGAAGGQRVSGDSGQADRPFASPSYSTSASASSSSSSSSSSILSASASGGPDPRRTGAVGGASPDEDVVNRIPLPTEDVEQNLPNMDELSDQFSKMLGDLLKSAGGDGAAGGASSFSGDGAGDVDATLRQAFEQLNSGTGAGNPEEILAQMTESMRSMESDPAFGGLIQQMMQTLLSKDVLYGPMAELAEKFPVWLAQNRMTIGARESETYDRQLVLIRRIVRMYDDGAPTDAIVETMTELQALGQPPKELLDQINAGSSVPGFLGGSSTGDAADASGSTSAAAADACKMQ